MCRYLGWDSRWPSGAWALICPPIISNLNNFILSAARLDPGWDQAGEEKQVAWRLCRARGKPGQVSRCTGRLVSYGLWEPGSSSGCLDKEHQQDRSWFVPNHWEIDFFPEYWWLLTSPPVSSPSPSLLFLLDSSSQISRCLHRTFLLHYLDWQICNCTETCEYTSVNSAMDDCARVKLVGRIRFHVWLRPHKCCRCRDGGERGRTMNEKAVGGEARSVISWCTAHFTKQMLDIWVECNIIRYTTCYNCHHYPAWAPVEDICPNFTLYIKKGFSQPERHYYAFVKLWLLHITVALPWRWGLSSCLPVSPIFGSQHLSVAAVNFKTHSQPEWPVIQ